MSKKDKQEYVVTFLNDAVERARSHLFPFHQQWFRNITSGMGEKTDIMRPKNRRLGEPLKPAPNTIHHRSNLIGEKCRKLMGYLSRSVPEMEIVAGNVEDPIQVDVARGANQWAKFHRNYEKFAVKRMQLLLWTVYCGMGVLRVRFNPTGGPRMRRGDSVTLTGMAETQVIPTFNFVYNVEAKNEFDLQFAGDQSYTSFAALESQLPGIRKKMNLASEDANSDHQASQYENLINQLAGHGNLSNLGLYQGLPGLVICNVHIAPFVLDKEEMDGLNGFSGEEYWNNGACVMVAPRQGKVLYCEPNHVMELDGVNPTSDWNPYSLYHCYQYPHRFLPQGVPEPLMSTIDGIDSIVGRLREAQRDMGKPKWMTPKNNGLTKADFTNAEGILTFNRSVGPPEAWTPPPMPAYFFSTLQMLEGHADRLSSQPPTMRGEASGQVRSGYGIRLLTEQAITEFSPILICHANSLSHHQRQILLQTSYYSTGPMLSKWITDTGEWAQALFFAQALHATFSVMVTPGSEQVTSLADQMAVLDRLVAWGALMPGMNPQHAELAARTMGYRIPTMAPDNVFEAIDIAREHCARLLIGGEFEIPVQPIWNHQTMANEIIRFMHTKRYRATAARSPMIAQAFYRHLGKLYAMIQAKMLGAMMPQSQNPANNIPIDAAQMQGGAPEQGGAPMGQGGPNYQIPNSSGSSARPGVGTQRGFSRGRQNEEAFASTASEGE